MTTLQFLGQLIPVLVAILGAVFWMNRRFNGLDRRLDATVRGVTTLAHQGRAHLTASRELIGTLAAAQVIQADRAAALIATALEPREIVDDFLREIRPAGNPLSQAEIDRLRGYVHRVHREERFTPEEAHDFHRISDTLTREYPAQEASWLLFLAAGIVLALLLLAPKK
jgi:hypothetical protein